jgi:16S rRNA (cytosine967-C5)-methyltransferase
MDEALSSRNASVNVIREIIIKGLPIEIVESRYLSKLSDRERKLSKAITSTTLRHMGEISYLIDKFMKNPFDNDSLEKNIMRIGVAQLLFMDSIPSHAAIHGAVELAKIRGKVRATGIINAILRRAQREGLPLLSKLNTHELNVPKWIKEKIILDHGPVRSEAIFEYMLKIAKIDLRVRNNDILTKEETEDFFYNIPIHEETYRLRKKHIPIVEIPGWDEGMIYVQDAAAQIPARIFKKLSIEGDILDSCAAPGGKTVQLLDLYPDRNIQALELNKDRIERISQNFERCQVHCPITVGDAAETTFENESFAGVLLDAPCSSTGTSRRHPDVLLTREPKDIQSLIKIQKNILKEAVRLLKPGGLIVYSTCSLFKDESEHQIVTFLEEYPDFERVEIKPEDVGGNEYIINENGELRTTPAENLDGFFTACVRKKEI